ncbi:hypothetical protein [Sulfurimonas sp.]
MKLLLFILISLNLHANIFSYYSYDVHTTNFVIKKFRKTVSKANAIVKKGDHTQYKIYKKDIATINKNIDSFDLSKEDKKRLKQKIKRYESIITTIYKNIQHSAPKLDQHYIASLHGLIKFNNGIASTGYGPLLKEWHDLSKIKYKYIKKPSELLVKKFNEKYEAVMLVLTDLCLDEELEEPLIAYLKLYKNYFHELDTVYRDVTYSKIRELKPLTYEIKSKLEFVIQEEM